MTKNVLLDIQIDASQPRIIPKKDSMTITVEDTVAAVSEIDDLVENEGCWAVSFSQVKEYDSYYFFYMILFTFSSAAAIT